MRDEVPEADAFEQELPVVDDDEAADGPHLDDEVPEADALEQSQPVPADEDEGRE